MNNYAVQQLALKHGFSLKQQASGNMDLHSYVYQFAEALLKQAKAEMQLENLVFSLASDSRLPVSNYPEIYDRGDKNLPCSNDILFFTASGECFTGWYVQLDDEDREVKFMTNHGDYSFSDDEVIHWVYLVNKNNQQQYMGDVCE